MDRDQLRWLHRNSDYIDAVEQSLSASSDLCDFLDDVNWFPRTLEEKEALESQTAKWKAARAGVWELRKTLLARYRLDGRGRKDSR
jgi:hypothetical protein